MKKKTCCDRNEGRDSSIIKIGAFNTHSLIMDRTIKQKINQEIEDLNNTINQLDLTGTY